jgi:hypothetical protein
VGDRYQLLYSLVSSSFVFSVVLWGNNNKMAAAAAGLLILVHTLLWDLLCWIGRF